MGAKESVMHLDIHARNVLITKALKELAVRRIGYALGRFAHGIRNITLRLADINGPRGGVDVEVLALVELSHGTRLVVRGQYDSPQDAISGIVERLRTSVGRSHDRAVRAFNGR
jgi:putative sigma-54 modulation protein